MAGTDRALEKLGLINRSAESWGVLASAPPPKTDPYCTGECAAGYNGRAVRKIVIGRPSNCPDCGHALVYKRSRAKED